MPESVVEPPLRVLLVDDTEDVRLLLRTLITDRSTAVVVGEAADGQEAIELAAALQPDLIVLDLAMPVLDGISALPRLLEAAPDTRVVVLSAFPAESQAPTAYAAGAVAYVEKAVSTDSIVDELLGGAGLLDAAVQALAPRASENFDADPASVSAARRFVVNTLSSWDEGNLADTITLLLSELVTNAIVHAQTAPDVSVRLLSDRVHVEVTDQRTEHVAAKQWDDESTSGRGLALVEALAMSWGSASLANGKVVWFDVARN